jgi:hypothetical protein
MNGTALSTKILSKCLFGAALCGALTALSCASARLEPAHADQKVANKPKAAAADVADGVKLQVEADSWMADERVKYQVTAMKVTLINLGTEPVSVDYNAFSLVSEAGKSFRPVAPDDIPIRGAARSIGLPADTIVTRTSDSAVNAPNRTDSEKQEIRERLREQSLKSGEVAAGERAVGYVFFERVPASVQSITFQGVVHDSKTGSALGKAELKFRPRQYQ